MPRLLALSCCFLFVFHVNAHAWSNPGHMTTAAIAYADLKERNPGALAEAVRILKKHPQFRDLWADKLAEAPAEERDLRLLMLAATWPDDIRGDEDYDHPIWHYVDIPYRPGYNEIKFPRGESILTAFPANRNIARSDIESDEARAVALCWMLHLIGDVHTPLHTTTLVNTEFPWPAGDRGGNLIYIRESQEGPACKLHRFWDNVGFYSTDPRTVRHRAEALVNNPAFRREQLTELGRGGGYPQPGGDRPPSYSSFNDWARASHVIAVENVYLRGALKPVSDQGQAPVLPRGYKEQAIKIAEKQIVLAGYRISDSLAQVFGTRKGSDQP